MENKEPRTTDERIDAIAMNLELLTHTVEYINPDMQAQARKTDERFNKLLTATENLLPISESHQRRLDDLER